MIGAPHPLVMRELANIERYDGKTAHHVWELILHINGTDYKMPLVMEQSVKRDYVLNFSDIFRVRFKCDAALYNTTVYPNRANLKATLLRRPVVIRTGGSKASGLYQISQYDVQLTDVGNSQMTGQNPFASNANMVNTHMLSEYDAQLLPHSISRLRATSSATNPLNCKAIDAVRTILTLFSRDSSDTSGESILGVDVADGYTEVMVPQIMIPHGTPLIQLPEVINRNSGGIYNTGFGYYLQGNHWYVYSPFDIERIDRGRYGRSLTVIAVPSYQLPGIEKTYRDTGTQIILISNGDVKQLDSSERIMNNDGSGARYADANRMLDGLSSFDQGKVDANPDEYINEYKVFDRPDGLNKLSAATRISANPRLENSRLAELKGMYIGAFWDNSAPELLYPGMPVKYVYIANSVPVELRGILLGADSRDNVVNKNVASPIFSTTTYLKLFIERKQT